MCNSDTGHNHLHLGCCNNPRGQLCSCHKIIHGIPGKEAFCPPRAVIPSSFLTGLCLVCHQKVLPMTVRFQSLSSTQAVNHTKEMVKLETQLFLSVQAVFQLDQTVRSGAGSGSVKVGGGRGRGGRGLLPLGAAQTRAGLRSPQTTTLTVPRLRRNRMFPRWLT